MLVQFQFNLKEFFTIFTFLYVFEWTLTLLVRFAGQIVVYKFGWFFVGVLMKYQIKPWEAKLQYLFKQYDSQKHLIL